MRLFRRRSAGAPPNPNKPVGRTETRLGPDAVPVVEMTGTTTFGADNLAALFSTHGHAEGGRLELTGQLVSEPGNSADPNAVAIHVEGARVGYLPGYLAAAAPYSDQVDICQVQLWGKHEPGRRLRVRGWVAVGSQRVSWPHDASNPPAVTIAERRADDAAGSIAMVSAALAEGGTRADEFRRGMVGGYHYLETVEPIKQLKREGKLGEALELCYGAIAAAERASAPHEPPPAYTEYAAIIHRKLGQRDEEEAVLRRWLALCPEEHRAGSRIAARLDKLLARS